jgi:membrane protein implicated in regulation of membrane protease activity
MKVSAVVVYAGAAVWIVTRWLHRLAGDPDGDEGRAGQQQRTERTGWRGRVGRAVDACQYAT